MYDLVASTKKVYSTPYPYLWVREGGGERRNRNVSGQVDSCVLLEHM